VDSRLRGSVAARLRGWVRLRDSVQRDGREGSPTRAGAVAVGKDLATVLEYDDPVAEQVPTLIRVSGHDNGG